MNFNELESFIVNFSPENNSTIESNTIDRDKCSISILLEKDELMDQIVIWDDFNYFYVSYESNDDELIEVNSKFKDYESILLFLNKLFDKYKK